MPVYYLDASALAKRFVHEHGSEWLNHLLERPGQDTFVSNELVVVEVVSAISRAHREKRISVGRRDSTILQLYDEAVQLMESVAVSKSIVRTASLLALKHGLRAYDAVHLATALDIVVDMVRLGLEEPVFISADAALLKAAAFEGLVIDNPNDHP
jgi:uncharacterized protein